MSDAGDNVIPLRPPGTLLPPDDEQLVRIVEALIFSSERPRSESEMTQIICDALGDPDGVSREQVTDAVDRLRSGLDERRSALMLLEVAGGWELRTRAVMAPWLQQLYKRRPVRLGRAALEVLALVAYRQPCTRADVDDVRGVDSSSTLRSLLGFGLIRILGRADDVGRPLMYGTTDEFLRVFGLKSLRDLPTLRDFAELTEEHMLTLAELERARGDVDTPDSSGDLDPLDAAPRRDDDEDPGVDAEHDGDDTPTT